MTTAIHIQYTKSAIGELIIGSFDNQLCLFDFRYRKMRQAVDTRIQKGLASPFVQQHDDIIEQANSQIE